MQEGQALWRPGRHFPELGGELVMARDDDGRCMIQFAKTPLPLVLAQTTRENWRIEFPARRMRFGGRQPPADPLRLALSACRAFWRAASLRLPLPAEARWRLAAGEHPLGRNGGRLLEPVRLLLKRWWWLILAVLAAIGMWRVRIDVEMLNLLPPDQPAVQGLKLYQQHFANARELIITLRAPDAEKAERLAGALATRLREETNLVAGVSWQPPWMEQPVQVAELVAWLWLSQPPETFSALSNRLAAGHRESVLAETKETLTTSLSPMDLARRAFDPYDLLSVPALTNFSGLSAEQGQGMFASPDGTFRVLYVQARPDLASYKSCASWLTSVQQAVAGLRTGQG